MFLRPLTSLLLLVAVSVQGPLCSWLCDLRPDPAQVASPAEAPCHGAEDAADRPEPGDGSNGGCADECPACDELVPLLATKDLDTSQAVALVTHTSRLPFEAARPATRNIERPPDEVPPRRSLLLLKSSLLL